MAILSKNGVFSYSLKSVYPPVLASAQAHGFERKNEHLCVTNRFTVAEQFLDYAEERTRKAVEASKATYLMSRSLYPEKALRGPRSGLEYLPYQQAGIEFIVKHPRTLLADPPGLGKTIQIAGVLNLLRVAKVLIVCPASLRINWKQEMDKWLSYTPEKLTIVSIDSLWRSKTFSEISKENYGFMAIDEAHYIKAQKSKRSTACYAIARKTPRVVCMTGTPVKNKPSDAYNIISTVDDSLFPDFMSFALRYCAAYQQKIRVKGGKIQYIWNFDGSSHEEELQEILRSTIMLRRSKEEALPQLPRKRRQIIELDAGKKEVREENKEWEKVCKSIGFDVAVKQMTEGVGTAFEQMASVRQKVAMAKIDAVVEHVSNILESGEKVILFAHHRQVIAELFEKLNAYNPVMYVGGMNDKQKNEAKTKFMEDEGCRVFIGNIVAAGTGLTLTVASTVVFAELSFCPSEMEQCEDRACRIGQTANSVLVQHLVLSGSLDVYMSRKLIEKQEVADKILDL